MPIKELKIDLTPHIKKIKLKARRDILNRMLEGNWSTVFKGEGLEFAGYRAYTYGDDASKIDWGASLRAHETLVRELEEYHNFNIFFAFSPNIFALSLSERKSAPLTALIASSRLKIPSDPKRTR